MSEFKVGDEVLVHGIKNVYLDGHSLDGQTGIIVGFLNNDYNWRVRLDDNLAVLAFKESELAHLTSVEDDKFDPIMYPRNYNTHPSGIEPIDITKHETFLRGNIIKYVMRAPYKGNELQDLLKARQYLDWEIDRVEGDEDG